MRTSIVEVGARRTRPAAWLWAWAPAVVGVAALLARPWFLPAGVDVVWRVAFFVSLGALGVAWPVTGRPPRENLPDRPPGPVTGLSPRDAVGGPAVSVAVLVIGGAAFAIGRVAVSVPLRPHGLVLAIALNALAAVAEEAFFRRYLYGLVAGSFGTGAAVGVTAVLFAVVHVTVWGWWVLPLDLAAGLLLSWQRAATGRWSVSAATHVLANTLALL